MKRHFTTFFQSMLLLAIMAGSSSAIAQQKTDSLKKALSTQKPDSNYVLISLKIGQLYAGKYDSILVYAQKALQMTQSLKLKQYETQAYQQIGASYYMKGDYDRSIATFRSLYNAAAAQKNYKDMALGLNNEANGLIEKGNFKQALENYKRSQELSREINDEVGVARAYNNISYVNKELGNYSAAIESYISAVKIYEGKQLYKEAAQTYTNIGYVYYRQKDYEQASEYVLKALAIQEERGYTDGIAISMEVLSSIYGMRQQYPEAIAYNKRAMAIHRAQNDVRQLAINNANLGELFGRQGTNDSAIFYYFNAISLYKKIGNLRGLPTTYNGAAAVLINARRLQEASDMLDSSKAILDKTGRKEDVKEYYLTLSLYHAAAGNHAEALNSYKKFTDIKDSILNQENTKIISEINTKYETEKKEAQIEKLDHESVVNNLTIKNQQLSLNKRLYELAAKALQLSAADLKLAQNDVELKTQQGRILRNRIDSIQARQTLEAYSTHNKLQSLTLKNQELTISRKNTVIIVSVIIFFLLLLVVYISYRRYKLKQKNHTQALLMKQQDLAAQEVIQAEENERKRIAADLHDGVGQIMSAAKMNLSALESQINFATDQQRQIFQSAISMVDDGCREVRSISHHMMPNALLKSGLVAAVREFVNRIAESVLHIQLHAEGLNDVIDKNTEIVLYRVLQECVHNVIKHAGATQLDISLIKDEDGISITIEDNGKGFNTANIKNFNGLGLGNMIKRIEYLKGSIEWSSEPNMGTLVSIHVPG